MATRKLRFAMVVEHCSRYGRRASCVISRLRVHPTECRTIDEQHAGNANYTGEITSGKEKWESVGSHAILAGIEGFRE